MSWAYGIWKRGGRGAVVAESGRLSTTLRRAGGDEPGVGDAKQPEEVGEAESQQAGECGAVVGVADLDYEPDHRQREIAHVGIGEAGEGGGGSVECEGPADGAAADGAAAWEQQRVGGDGAAFDDEPEGEAWRVEEMELVVDIGRGERVRCGRVKRGRICRGAGGPINRKRGF